MGEGCDWEMEGTLRVWVKGSVACSRTEGERVGIDHGIRSLETSWPSSELPFPHMPSVSVLVWPVFERTGSPILDQTRSNSWCG